MSSQIEEINYNQEQSLPDPKRIKLTNDFDTQAVKLKSCTNTDNNNKGNSQQQVTHFV